MSFYTKYFLMLLGMAVGAITASLIFLHLKEGHGVREDTTSLLPFCTNMVENKGDLGGDNYDWGLLTQSCLDGDRVIYFGVPNEQHN